MSVCLPILFADSLHDNELTEHNLGFKHWLYSVAEMDIDLQFETQ